MIPTSVGWLAVGSLWPDQVLAGMHRSGSQDWRFVMLKFELEGVSHDDR